jgi:hypothetical protein
MWQMIQNINTNSVGHLIGQSSFAASDPVAARPTNDADAALHVSFDDLINKAKAPDPAEATAVEEARQLLISGQLTSPQNIQSAAQNILRFGI